MRHLKVLLAILALLLCVEAPSEVFSQQRRPQPKPVRKTVSTPATTPTFDSVLGADTYNVYVEVRGVGQLIRSNSVNEILEPVMKLADPPKEFKTLINWLNTRADDVMTSRMFVAAWPMSKNIPEALVAIEFSSVEDAAKFEPRLNSFLPKLLPPPAPEESPSPTTDASKTTKPAENTPPKPGYYLQQVGSLILITPTPLKLKDLRPAKLKLMSEDPAFRVARNRFASEEIFAYVDIKGIETETQNQRKERMIEEAKQVEEEAKEEAKEAAKKQAVNEPEEGEKKDNQEEEQPNNETNFTLTEEVRNVGPPAPDQLTTAVDMLANSFFVGEPKYPDAVGFGIALENDSFDVRALMITMPGEKCDPIPFFPNLIPGPPIVPESPAILPADTELFVSASLDLPQIYASMSKQPRPDQGDEPEIKTVSNEEFVSPFAELEKRLKIKIKEELLPLLGPEVVVSIPLRMIEDGGVPKAAVEANPSSSPSQSAEKPPSGPSFVIAFSLKDKEGMRTLLPKIIESIGFKGASALAQTERRENIELVSYANAFSYAFIDNFMVLSTDSAAVKHVVDSYLKHETLSSDTQFKNYTRWQPRQLQGQVYVSPALMESYRSWTSQPNTMMNDQMREILARLSLVAQPVTYSLSNDGLGTMHEVHVPKNLILMAVAGIASESNPSPILQNERATMGILHVIASAELEYQSKKGQGSFATLEQLIAEDLVSKDFMKSRGYKIEVTLVGNKFEITAVPDEYGKTGRTSFFIDQTSVLRGADKGGTAATADDPVH